MDCIEYLKHLVLNLAQDFTSLRQMSELIQTTFNLPALPGLADASKKRRVMKRPSSSQELVGTQADVEDGGEIRDREGGEEEENEHDDDEGEEEDQPDGDEPLVHDGDAKKMKKRPAARGARGGSKRTCLELL